MRLAGESVNTNASTSIVSGNGTSHSSKFLGGSKSNSVVYRSLTIKKGQSCASENTDEGNNICLTFLIKLISSVFDFRISNYYFMMCAQVVKLISENFLMFQRKL